MSRLVDKERLAKLAQALDARAKAAVAAEESRAKRAEQGLQNAIDIINNAETGILAQAKADAKTKDDEVRADFAAEDAKLQQNIDDEAAARSAADTRIEGKADANAADIVIIEAKDVEQDGRLDALEDLFEGDNSVDKKIEAVQDALDAFIEEQAEKDNGQDGRLTAVEGKATTNANDIVNLKAKDEELAGDIADINDAASALQARVKANEDAIVIINGEDNVEGSIAKAEKDAKDYADAQIAALVDSAPDAMNTLNELAEAINDNKDIYDAYIAEHATAMATMKSDLQAEIDADVKVVADALADEKNAEKDGSLANKIKAEEDARKAADSALDNRVKANEAFVAAQPAIDEAQNNRLTALEAKFNGDESVDAKIQAVQGNLDKHIENYNEKVADLDAEDLRLDGAVKAAQQAADKAQGEVDAVEERMNTAEGEIDALQAFMNGHSHATMEQGIADNKADIAVLNGDANTEGSVAKAIADALEDYTDTEGMKAILGNVVNSLALSVADNKLMLKLGGVEGITLHTTELEMATDADIDAIIAGLDSAN